MQKGNKWMIGSHLRRTRRKGPNETREQGLVCRRGVRCNLGCKNVSKGWEQQLGIRITKTRLICKNVNIRVEWSLSGGEKLFNIKFVA